MSKETVVTKYHGNNKRRSRGGGGEAHQECWKELETNPIGRLGGGGEVGAFHGCKAMGRLQSSKK